MLKDLEKIVVSYTDPEIYSYFQELDPKNYNEDGYVKLLNACNLIEAEKLGNKYVTNKNIILKDDKDPKSLKYKIKKCQITIISNILKTLQNWKIIQFSENLNATSIYKRNKHKDTLKFKLKFLIDISNPKYKFFKLNKKFRFQEVIGLQASYEHDLYMEFYDYLHPIKNCVGLWKLLSDILKNIMIQ